MKTVTLYTRHNCCLCHEARDTIESVARSHPLELRVVDIDRDLHKDDPRRRRFAIDIPVVEIDGAVVFEHQVDAEALGRMLLEGSEFE
jgi:glutaredoxin